MKVIGIDLGTTNSCVAVLEEGKTVVYETGYQSRVLPSYVAFTDVDLIIGEEAKKEAPVNASNTVFDAKRLIGRTFDDENVAKDMALWPFAVENDNGKPQIRVSFLKKEKRLFAEEISAMVLLRLKEIAEEKLGEEVTQAVITVPAYFNDCQKQATMKAGEIAGLEVLRLITEPTAAALAFAFGRKFKQKSNILVYDLGGGTFDVSVVSVNNKDVEVKAVSGDTYLGGNDFDTAVLKYILEEIKKEHGKDLKEDKKAIAKLRLAVEDAKMALSAPRRYQAVVRVDALLDGRDFRYELTRAKFDEICGDLMKRTLKFVEDALNKANIPKEKVDDILLVGGSTRIWKIQSLLQDFFNGKELNRSVNPEEAVACGAAIQASVLQSNKNELTADLNLKDVTALSYGIEVKGGLMCVIVPRNTPYPIKLSKGFQTVCDNQVEGLVNVYQGERDMAKDNLHLGSFSITLPPKRKGVVEVDSIMEIDENGILVVSVVERSTGISEKIEISHTMKRLSKENIKELIAKAKEMKAADIKERERIIAVNELESYIYDLQHSINEDFSTNKYSDETKNLVQEVLDGVKGWLTQNPNASKDIVESRIDILRQQQQVLKKL